MTEQINGGRNRFSIYYGVYILFEIYRIWIKFISQRNMVLVENKDFLRCEKVAKNENKRTFMFIFLPFRVSIWLEMNIFEILAF